MSLLKPLFLASFHKTQTFPTTSCHTSWPLMRHNYTHSWEAFVNNAIRWSWWAPPKDRGAILVEEERDATWSETPPASQPVFCGSSLQDAPSCQAVPRASAELRGMEQPGRHLHWEGSGLVRKIRVFFHQIRVVLFALWLRYAKEWKAQFTATIGSLFFSLALVQLKDKGKGGKAALLSLYNELYSEITRWEWRTWSTVTMSSMDDACALRNNGHPSQGEDA